MMSETRPLYFRTILTKEMQVSFVNEAPDTLHIRYPDDSGYRMLNLSLNRISDNRTIWYPETATLDRFIQKENISLL